MLPYQIIAAEHLLNQIKIASGNTSTENLLKCHPEDDNVKIITAFFQ